MKSFQERIRDAYKSVRPDGLISEMDCNQLHRINNFEVDVEEWNNILLKKEPGDSRDADGKTWRDRGPLL